MRTFVPGCRQSSWLAAPLHDAPDRLGLGSRAIERAVKSLGVVFFRSGGDGGRGRTAAGAAAGAVVGVGHVGQVSQ